MRSILSREPSLLYVVVIMPSTELSGEIFAVLRSLYAVRKFDLGRPSERGENGWEYFDEQLEYEKRQKF